MKRLIAALALALSVAPAFADIGAPFEQNQLDRALPSLPDNVVTSGPTASERMPFEQTKFDRGHLSTPEPVRLVQIGSASYKSNEGGESVWANDHNFIAPAP